VYRYEQSGELGGMTRVRGFTQDDAHLFCTQEQVEDEFRGCLEMTQYVLKTLGFSHYRVRLGFRDPDSSKYVGSQESWAKAQQALEGVCRGVNLPSLSIEQGEAAFYGPKADFLVTDCLGREWQLGTVQLDYNLPERFDLTYIGADDQKHRPVMIHRAPFGSLERFIGVLIEHCGGNFPSWLAPVQVMVIPVGQDFEAYAQEVAAGLRAASLRAEVDLRSEKVGYKIRGAEVQKIPYMLVVGQREQEDGSVAVRRHGEGDQGTVPLDAFITRIREEIADATRQTAESR
jgi:threonyl-tRNA synthetase